MTEFRRLCQVHEWDKNSPQWAQAKSDFRDALIRQFNSSYGTDIHDLSGWHAMMTHMGVDPLPDTVSACKKVSHRR